MINDGSATYLYDRANRLISTTVSGVNSLFDYNGDGARLRQISAGVPTTYTQDLAAPLPVVLQSKTGANATRYVYALGTRPIAQSSTAWEYLLPDALGSIRQIADANGNVTLAKSYEPYGTVLTSNGTASSIFAYAGEQADTYIKLLFLRARYYSPDTARFLSKDVWQGDYTRPQSLNAWMYVEGDPINRADPSGHDPWWCDQEPDSETCRRDYLRSQGIDTTSEQEVLQSTIRIALIVLDTVCYQDSQLTPKYDVTPGLAVEGLGTLVQYNGAFEIYTNDHWGTEAGRVVLNADEAVFYDAKANIVGTAKADFAKQLFSFDDSGTKVTLAPSSLDPGLLAPFGLKYASFGSPDQIQKGYHVKQPLRTANDNIGVVEGVVEEPSVIVEGISTLKIRPTIITQGGDSGGGIWFKGQVIGNHLGSAYPYTFAARLPSKYYAP